MRRRNRVSNLTAGIIGVVVVAVISYFVFGVRRTETADQTRTYA